MIPNDIEYFKLEYNGVQVLTELIPYLKTRFLFKSTQYMKPVIKKEVHNFLKHKIADKDISEKFAEELENFLVDNIKYE